MYEDDPREFVEQVEKTRPKVTPDMAKSLVTCDLDAKWRSACSSCDDGICTNQDRQFVFETLIKSGIDNESAISVSNLFCTQKPKVDDHCGFQVIDGA